MKGSSLHSQQQPPKDGYSFWKRRLSLFLFLVAMKVSFDLSLSQHVSVRQVQAIMAKSQQEAAMLGSFLRASSEPITSTWQQPQLKQQESSSIYADQGPKSKFAYAVVIGGCDLRTKRYRGFLYNTLVTSQILHEQGSTMDIVLFVQIQFQDVRNTLPEEDLRWLHALPSNIRVKYLPKSQHQSFYETVLNKFQVLTLVEYERVLLLDGDVMPMTNLDYLFDLSVQGILQPNVVVAGLWEPANAGFFMVTPGPQEYALILDIIQQRETHALELEGRKFDVVWGWGHEMQAPHDMWRSRMDMGTNWTFHFAFSDQGLLFHFTKYVKKSVSIIYGDNLVETWGSSIPTAANKNSTVQLVSNNTVPFDKYRNLLLTDSYACRLFLCDFYHFTGKKKPWMDPPIEGYKNPDSSMLKMKRRPLHLWWHTFYKLNDKLQMKLNLDDWKTKVKPPLGFYATYTDLEKTVMRRKEIGNATEDNSMQPPKKQEPLPQSQPDVNTTPDSSLPLLGGNSATSESSSVPSVSSELMSNYAYVYIMAGCNANDKRYKGFMYNILVSARILQEEGAQADIVVLVQMSTDTTEVELPKEDQELMASGGVTTIEYIPKSATADFYETVTVNKFRVLTLTQYRRVIVLDGDVLPMANPDYLFQLSDGPNPTIKENLIVAGPKEPAIGALFMLEPKEGEYERVLDIIKQREERAVRLINDGSSNEVLFDEDIGWGHRIDSNDPWENRRGEKGTKWDFQHAYSDQGLLYYYVKYVRKSVSIVYGFAALGVQNWGPSPDGTTVELQKRLKSPFKGLFDARIEVFTQCKNFLCDFMHFSGQKKPWLNQPPADIRSLDHEYRDPTQMWWHTLYEIDEEFDLDIDFKNWQVRYPYLGITQKFSEANDRVRKRAKIS